MTTAASGSDTPDETTLMTLRQVNQLLDHAAASLADVGHRSLAGTVLQILICNTDAMKDKAGYGNAATLLDMAYSKLDTVSSLSMQAPAQMIWQKIRQVPFPRFIEQLQLRYGADNIRAKIQRVQKDLCDLIQLLE